MSKESLINGHANRSHICTHLVTSASLLTWSSRSYSQFYITSTSKGQNRRPPTRYFRVKPHESYAPFCLVAVFAQHLLPAGSGLSTSTELLQLIKQASMLLKSTQGTLSFSPNPRDLKNTIQLKREVYHFFFPCLRVGLLSRLRLQKFIRHY